MPPPAGIKPDARLDQADVGLGGGEHTIAVEADLAAAAERQPGRRDDHRDVGVLQRHGRALESPDHQVDLVPVALLRFEQQQQQVGAGREVRRLVADDQGPEVGRRLARRPPRSSRGRRRRWCSSSSGTRPPARRRRDRPGCRRRCRAATPPRSRAVRRISQIGRGRRDRARARRRRRRPGAERAARQRLDDQRREVGRAARLDDFANADRVPRLERPELPAESPAHRPVDVVDRAGDVRRDARRVEQQRPERVAQQLAGAVGAEEQRADPIAGVCRWCGRCQIAGRRTGCAAR